MIRARENYIGAWAYLIGLIVTIVVGIFMRDRIGPTYFTILFLLGLIIGYFVSEKDVQIFLLASVSLVIVTSMGMQGFLLGSAVSGTYTGKSISSIFQSLLGLFVPATIVVAMKTVFSISKK